MYYSFLKALDSTKPCVDLPETEVCKVNSEFHFIQSLFYEEMQQTPHIAIVLNGVKADELPDVFRGRIHCQFPKSFGMEDEDARQLMGLVLGEEPIRVA